MKLVQLAADEEKDEEDIEEEGNEGDGRRKRYLSKR